MAKYSLLLNLDELETKILESLTAIRGLNKTDVMKTLLREESQRILTAVNSPSSPRSFNGKVEKEAHAMTA